MTKSIRVYTKLKRPAVTGTMVGVRLQPDALARLDAFRAKQKPRPTRPEAVRQLIEIALSKTDKK